MEYFVNRLDSKYNFTISGVSYIGNPKMNTAMYVSKKAGHLVKNLENIQDCLVFAEEGVEVQDKLRRKNCFVFCENAQQTYARFVNDFAEEKHNIDRGRSFKLTDTGYYLGENVQIGYNSYIEPGCVIGHDVAIGSNAVILVGSVIKNAVIGDDFFCNENAVIGASGFTMTEDEVGNKFRIPTLGRVKIGNHVEVGAHDNISSGTGGDTVIEDYVKLDALVHVGHDAYLSKNVEVTAGCVIGGFACLGSRVYVGINSCIRNRINIGENGIIGMGATVTKSVEPNTTVVGNPAKALIKDTIPFCSNQSMG